MNGFGRIERTILRQVLDRPEGNIEIVVINDVAPIENCAYLFQYDSTFGPYPHPATIEDRRLRAKRRAFPVHTLRSLAGLDLSALDVVLECTGIARTSDIVRQGLDAGARSALISGPSPAAEITYLPDKF